MERGNRPESMAEILEEVAHYVASDLLGLYACLDRLPSCGTRNEASHHSTQIVVVQVCAYLVQYDHPR